MLSLTGAIPPELGELRKLTELHLNDNKLTGEDYPSKSAVFYRLVRDLGLIGIYTSSKFHGQHGHHQHSWVS